jgi:toluene monooxygenase system protein A
LGLERPWYWDELLADTETHHHNQHLALWTWRKGIYWNPAAGVSPDERAWLETKYPGWNDTYGKYWDVVTENARAGRFEATEGKGMPCLCNMCQHSITGMGGTRWDARVQQTTYDGRRFNFCGPVCQWIFELDPERYADSETLVDRVYSGEIDTSSPEGLLKYMGIGIISEGGKDATDFAWARQERQFATAAE